MKAAQVSGTGAEQKPRQGHVVCARTGTGTHGFRTGACALGCALLLQGCATRALPPENTDTAGTARNYVYVLAPAGLMLHMSAENPPLLAAEGLPEDLPVFPSREAARRWLDAEVQNDRIMPGLWRVYRLEGSWPADVVEQRPGEGRMRHEAHIYPVI